MVVANVLVRLKLARLVVLSQLGPTFELADGFPTAPVGRPLVRSVFVEYISVTN